MILFLFIFYYLYLTVSYSRVWLEKFSLLPGFRNCKGSVSIWWINDRTMPSSVIKLGILCLIWWHSLLSSSLLPCLLSNFNQHWLSAFYLFNNVAWKQQWIKHSLYYSGSHSLLGDRNTWTRSQINFNK